MKKIQESAKNVQKAIEQGLKNLGVALEDVDVKILDEGGLFRKAKVELIFDDGVEEIIVVEEEIKNNVKKSADKKLSKKAEKENIKEDKKALKQDKKISKEENKTEEKTDKTLEVFCKKFLEDLCVKMNIEAQISFEKKEDGTHFNVSGEKVGPLIGKRGETLNAIQEILSNVAKKEGFKEERIYFDVENYKTRRELSLVGLAERMAKKALKIEKPIRLERMNSYERKIIHTALQDCDGITTRSEGEEPNRYLVIIPNNRAEKFREKNID
ncbi:MAG: KH domain-containing protein [Clostridia bacterium]|nr:KH domain-containing protein [Clostridia bacterium]